jgi:hypothetical protein
MKFFQPLPIEQFVTTIMTEEREVFRITENWNIEKEEVIQILVAHFRSLGIYVVKPLSFADIIKQNMVFQLKFNPQLRNRLVQIAREIERMKTKHTRHNV